MTPAPGSDPVSHDPASTGDASRTKRGLTLTAPGRDWLARGAFEAALILLGLLGAFALNQWQDARQRANRADAMIVAIRAELEANLERQAQAAAYNLQLVDELKKLAASGETFVPSGVYGNGGLFKRPRLTAAAWTAAQNGGILEELPVDTILVLAKVYESQRDYQDAVAALFETLYAAALRDTAYRRDGVEGAPQLAGVLNDFARLGAALARDYEWVLDYLNGAVPLPEAAPATPPEPITDAAATPSATPAESETARGAQP